MRERTAVHGTLLARGGHELTRDGRPWRSVVRFSHPRRRVTTLIRMLLAPATLTEGRQLMPSHCASLAPNIARQHAKRPADVSSRTDETRRSPELRSVLLSRHPCRLVRRHRRWFACDHFSFHRSGCSIVWFDWRMGRLAHAQGSQKTHASKTGRYDCRHDCSHWRCSRSGDSTLGTAAWHCWA